jgi:hypothetical protein
MRRKFHPQSERDREYIDTITHIARTLYEYQVARRLMGACHELSAIGYLLLQETGIEKAELCIGVVYSPYAPPLVPSDGIDFDHSWIEIAGAPLDVACAAPLAGLGVPIAPVILGMHVDDGRPSELRYGVPGTLDEAAAKVARMTIAEYFDAQDFGDVDREGDPTLWEVTVELGSMLGLASDQQVLRTRHGAKRWSLRTRSARS